VPRTGRFSGVDQGRHSNHLHAVGLVTLGAKITSSEGRASST
jgi:hypothetical protein